MHVAPRHATHLNPDKNGYLIMETHFSHSKQPSRMRLLYSVDKILQKTKISTLFALESMKEKIWGLSAHQSEPTTLRHNQNKCLCTVF